MKVVIFGGNGQVGTLLARYFYQQSHAVTIVQRKTESKQPWTVVAWDGKTVGDWTSTVDGADVVINLAGRSVNCRYTTENQKEIIESRVHSTQAVGHAICTVKNPPPLWLQMSTATIYAHRFDAANDEFNGLIGAGELDAPDKWRFSIKVVEAWEKAATEFKTPHTRLVLLRTSIVMSPDSGGAFDTILRLVRLGLGGQNGSGKQYISWISDTDFIRAVQFIIDQKQISGPVIMASPNPLPNAAFMAKLRKAWGTPVGLPSMDWMIEIGAMLLGTEPELILKSRRVIPAKLLQEGFKFHHSHWDEAAQDLCERWRKLH